MFLLHRTILNLEQICSYFEIDISIEVILFLNKCGAKSFISTAALLTDYKELLLKIPQNTDMAVPIPLQNMVCQWFLTTEQGPHSIRLTPQLQFSQFRRGGV
jgi:hypothetical protein